MYRANENIRDNKKMKYFLEENVKELICFTPACWIHGNPIVDYAHEVITADHAIASVIGYVIKRSLITLQSKST